MVGGGVCPGWLGEVCPEGGGGSLSSWQVTVRGSLSGGVSVTETSVHLRQRAVRILLKCILVSLVKRNLCRTRVMTTVYLVELRFSSGLHLEPSPEFELEKLTVSGMGEL